MRIHLTDDDAAVVTAWRAVFVAEANVTIACENILAVAHGALVSPANSAGHMDGGIDAAYLAFLGHGLQERVYEAVGRRIEGRLPIGAAEIVATGHARIPYLVVAPTMETPGEVEAANCYRAFRAALRVAHRHAGFVEDLFCPGLTTGIGRVAPEDMAVEMHRALVCSRERP